MPLQAEEAAAVNEVHRLKNAGLPEETTVPFIRSRNKNYALSAERIIVLQTINQTTNETLEKLNT